MFFLFHTFVFVRICYLNPLTLALTWTPPVCQVKSEKTEIMLPYIRPVDEALFVLLASMTIR